MIRDVKDRTYCKEYVEGKNIDRYIIRTVKFLEWGTARVPRKLVRKTFPELYKQPKILRGILTGAILDENNLICNHSIMVFVKYIDLHGVNNKSIMNSIKKFNKLTREQLEKVSMNYDLKYLLAIINSKFSYLHLNNHRRHRLENYFYPYDLRNLPIPEVDINRQKPVTDLVDKILAITKDGDYLENSFKQSQVKKYEKQIDQLVYQLYGLSDKEIKIVEGEKS